MNDNDIAYKKNFSSRRQDGKRKCKAGNDAVGNDVTTGIYNTAGQRITVTQHGQIYIVGGRKVLVK